MQTPIARRIITVTDKNIYCASQQSMERVKGIERNSPHSYVATFTAKIPNAYM